MSDTPTFPFVAVTGQATLKLALVLITINPLIGGLLISGPRGSAKTTLARGISDLLPVASHGNFVTLPLGASEEMLIGSLDLQKALNNQEVMFNPGLLAKAHQGVLYVDEVNLLPDSLVDQLLDVAASRTNLIERDGISHQHAADFLLIGTMNPDEGELRPQLQDRFGLSVTLSNQYSIDERIEIVERREAFDQSPATFIEDYASQQAALISRIEHAKSLLHNVKCSSSMRKEIAQSCHAAHVDGMRADIVWYRAAVSHAAWQGRDTVLLDDIQAVESLVLEHRRNEMTQSPPPTSTPPPFSRPPTKPTEPKDTQKEQQAQQQQSSSTEENGDSDWGSMPPQQQIADAINPLDFAAVNKKTEFTPNIAHTSLLAGRQKGDTSGGSRLGKLTSGHINWFTSFAANTRHPKDPSQWQLKFKKARTGKAVLHLILLDTSASTLAAQAFAKSKSVVLQIAEQA